MTSFSVTSFKKAILEFQEDFAKFPTQQKSDLLFPSRQSSEASRRPPVTRRSDFRSDNRATPSGRSSVFKKNPDFLCRHGSGKTTYNRPDLALIRKHMKCIMERWLHSSLSGHSMPPSRHRQEKSESVAI
jgi:hypothetical protein